MITINDIAHHLSIENRFGGATRFAYSVGYHSILACNFAPDNLKLEALLHDAHEAYIKDLPNPLKRLIRAKTESYDNIAKDIDVLLAYKFQLSIDENDWSITKDIDLRLAITERNCLLSACPEQWIKEYEDKKPYNMEIMKLQPENVEELFLKEYEKWRRN